MAIAVAENVNAFPCRQRVLAEARESITKFEADGFAPLRQFGTAAYFGRNETIFVEGEPAEYSYKVVSGTIRLFKMLPDGRRQIAKFFLPGDYFGLGEDSEYLFTAEAVSEANVICYSRRRIEGLCEEIPTVRKEMLSRIYRDLSAAQNHLVLLGRQTAKERVASFLLRLADRAMAKDGDGISLPMGRQDIADYLGLTIETVCRALSDLKKAKLISTPDTHQVIILDLQSLKGVCERELAVHSN